ncbi:FAD-dependent oxidoreductase, partial [Arthrospira platensis SPKY1]|nr:FAD-dependent oxidoreductase [Arthrospira platensis SPKY1]
GRIVTFREKDIQYEIGAGRIFHTHAKVLKLIKHFGLHTFPIATTTNFEDQQNSFYALFEPLRRVCKTLPKRTLATHTIRELLPPALHPILDMYPYRSEIDLLRADLALDLFE